MPSTLVLPQTDVPAFTATYPINEAGQVVMVDGPVAGGNFLGTLDGAKRLRASYCVDIDLNLFTSTTYSQASVTADGKAYGNAVPRAGAVSWLVANFGAAAVTTQQQDALQAAIWRTEYGTAFQLDGVDNNEGAPMINATIAPIYKSYLTALGSNTAPLSALVWISPGANPDNTRGQSLVALIDQPARALPTRAVPNANGSVTVTYQLTASLAAGQTIPIGVYWGKGPLGTDAISKNTSGGPTPLFTFTATATNSTTAHLNTFTVPAANMTVAPHGATYLLVVANPAKNLVAGGDPQAVLALHGDINPLTAGQLQKLMPGLSLTAAQRYAPALNNTLNQFHILTLEQRAMFLGQLAVESQNLQTWSENFVGTDPVTYFINKYWVPTNQWSGLGASVPTANGITLKVAHTTGANKTYDLYWSTSATLTTAATLYQHKAFSYASGFYTAQFAGAVPPKYTTYLLVVDPSSKQVVLAIHNKLGNWSPADAAAYRGRGPMQITGRYNYQKFADFAGVPALMTNPSMLGDTTNPALGMKSAGWFWETAYNHHLNVKTDSFAWQGTSALNTAITQVIDPGLAALSNRLANYLRIRSQLLSSGF
jgi:predicted chitinase